jgi:hypothetical protein
MILRRPEVAPQPSPDIEASMYRTARIALFVLLVLPACRTARDVAESSAHVATAPARFVGRKLHGTDENPDVTTQVYEAPPVQQPPPPPPAVVRTTPARPRENPPAYSPAPSRSVEHVASTQPTPASTPRSSATAQFPVAKPVPGKPGYVFSPYDPNGGYVDVTGYQSGSKVKDPYSQKIFLVP